MIDALTDLGDQITGFEAGATNDELDLSAAAVKPSIVGLSSGSKTAANWGSAGFFVIDADTAGASATMNATDVAAAATTNFDNIDANEVALVLLKADHDNANSDAFILSLIHISEPTRRP